MQISELIFYRPCKGTDYSLLEDMCNLFEKEEEAEIRQERFYRVVSKLYKYASENGFTGNLWHDYLTELLVYNENPYTIACELRGYVEGTLNKAVVHDLRIFRDMFAYDLKSLEDTIGDTKDMTILTSFEPSGKGAIKYNKNIVAKINELANNLGNAESIEAFKNYLDQFYGSYGVGVFGLHKAFRVEHTKDGLDIDPIYNIAVTSLDDLVGYEIPKQKILDNTNAFLAGHKSNNCLIFGDAGTGKSSSIRAILNQYYDKGLRMIEVYKHQYQELNALIDMLKVRNYKFIIYMDDLSFEEFETEYKYLKAVIEGGLESKPDNVLIYATSNRRHLIKETFADNDSPNGDIHKNETIQEKMSLFARFGVSIYFEAPSPAEYQQIVLALAKRYKIAMEEEELLLEANKWELAHGGLSGRTASQFIDSLRGKNLSN